MKASIILEIPPAKPVSARHTLFIRRILALGTGLALLHGGTTGVLGITGGVPDGDGHPNVGAIVVAPGGDPVASFQLCSGTLIEDGNNESRVFLTAGHCVAGVLYFLDIGMMDFSDVYVSFNPDDVLDPATWTPVTDLWLHPEYATHHMSSSGHFNDLGLLVLETPQQGITPVALPPVGYLDQLRKSGVLRGGPKQAKFTVVGYGSFFDWPPPQVIWHNRTRYVAESGFLGFNKDWLFLSQNLAVGNGGSGYGDSGGPTFWHDASNDKKVLVSITSWGDPLLVATGISYRIDTRESLDLIQGVIQQLNE